MNTITSSQIRPALIAFGCAFVLALSSFSTAGAADALTLQPRAEHAKSLPLVPKFEKGTEETGPHILTLTNTSKDSLKVDVLVHESVLVHSKPKDRTLAAQVIEAGKALTIEKLAATDKVTVTADGFEKLEIVVP